MPWCTPCGRSFIDNNALLMHTKSKHLYECSHCDRAFKTSEGRDQHEKSKHPEYECTHCDRTFTTLKGREKHEASKHPSYECSYCNCTFKTSQGRDQHEEVKHAGYECTHCNSTFSTPGGRDQHEKAKHRFHCSLCNREFLSESALDQHDEALHSGYECTYCDKEFSSAEGRAQHESAKHIRPSTAYSSYQLRNPGYTTALIPPPMVNVVNKSQIEISAHTDRVPSPKNAHLAIVRSAPPPYTQTTVEPAPVEQPRVPDSLPTQIPIPALPDDGSEEDHDSNIEENDSNGKNSCSDNSGGNYDDDSEEDCDGNSEASYDGSSEDNYDDNSEEIHDDNSEETNGDHSEETHDDLNGVSIAWSPMVQATVPEPVANLTCKTCGRHFTTTSALGIHESQEHNEVCACKICERVSCICSCGICKRASTLPVFVGDEKPIANSGPLTSAFSEDSSGVAEPKVIEDSSVESQFPNPEVYAVLREITRFIELCAEDGEPLSSWIFSRLYSPQGNENDGLDPSNTEIKLKEEGVTPNSVRLECDSVLCEKDILEHHATEAASIDARLVTSNLADDGREYLSDHDSLVDPKIESHSGPSTEACDDQQASPDAETKHQPISDLVGSCTLGLEHDVASSFPGEPPASDTVSPVEIEPVHRHSPQCIILPQVCTAELESTELDDPSTRNLIPSPTPSEQGSLRPLSVVLGSSHPPLSPSTSEGSADYFSEIEHPSNPSSPLSEHSIVFVSAESIPEYLRDNRAYLVATSAPSRPSSAASSYIRLPSVATSSDSTPPQEGSIPADSVPTNGPSRLYCRVCHRDPCDDLTATMCGHIFCNRCIIGVVMTRSACPVCNAPTLLYCLFRLDI